MNKPIKPDITIPESFADTGVKTDFDKDLLANGFDNLRPDVLAGDNLNKFIDDTYKGLNYGMAAADAINLINEGETLTIKDGQFVSDKISGGAGLPVGTVFTHTCSASFVPENSLPCNGSEYTQAQFPNLYNDWLVGGKLKTCTYTEYSNMLTTYGQCPMWALDATNKKFKVPTIKDGAVVQQAMSNSEIGKAYNAGLPNITGTLAHVTITDNAIVTKSGAFSGSTELNTSLQNYYANTKNADGITANFDASDSNSIYGNSSTVQMNAVALRYFVVVATKAISQSAMDWSNWASSLNGKLNADHSNDSKPYITQTYRNGASWYRVWSDGWCEQGGFITSVTANALSSATITFLKSFSDTNYFVSLEEVKNNNTSNAEATGSHAVYTKNKNNMVIATFSWTNGRLWEAKGYIA